MKFGRVTRILHSLIAAGILLELLLSLEMKTPRPGRVLTPLQSFNCEAHIMMHLGLGHRSILSIFRW